MMHTLLVNVYESHIGNFKCIYCKNSRYFLSQKGYSLKGHTSLRIPTLWTCSP